MIGNLFTAPRGSLDRGGSEVVIRRGASSFVCEVAKFASRAGDGARVGMFVLATCGFPDDA